MTALLSIGEFATVTHLSVKTLRRYHEDGLLEPDQVDPHSGYRYYSTDQVPTAQVIRRFRDLDMPVREIARLLAADVDERATLITDHLARLQQRLAATTEAVGALQRLLTAEPRPLPVEHRREPARRVTAVVGQVELDGVLDWYSAAMTEIEAAVAAAGARPTGPPGGHYDNALFTDGAGHATVFVPTDRDVRAGRVHPIDLAGPRARAHGAPRPARRHRRHLRRARRPPRRARPARRRPRARDLPGGAPRHRRPRRVAHRDRVAGVHDRARVGTSAKTSATQSATKVLTCGRWSSPMCSVAPSSGVNTRSSRRGLFTACS